ncbi:phage portal protein [Allostella vacuolata]|nr:phage portal protein [Stella vacuolata]
MKLPPPSRLDRAIAYFAPATAARRIVARAQIAQYSALTGGGSYGGYDGARRDRAATQRWRPRGSSADAALLPDLPDLRDRGLALVRNHPIARGALSGTVTKVVGPGLKLKARIDRKRLGIGEEAADAWEHEAEALYRECTSSIDIDVTRTQRLTGGLDDLVLRAMLGEGDCAVIRRWKERPGRRFALALQVVEGARLANPQGRRDDETLRAGVQIDADGAPVGYHFRNRHPGDLGRLDTGSTYVPAFGAGSGEQHVLHIFRRLYIGQHRGEPFLAPVIEPLKQLGRYSNAELMAAVVTSCFAIESSSAQGPAASPLRSVNPGAGAGKKEKIHIDEGGLIIDLGPDEKVAAFESGRPNSQFDPFFMAIVRQIGIALELPSEVLLKTFTASYSAARAALLDAWHFFRTVRAWLAQALHQPVYEWVLAEAVARGYLRAPGFFDRPEMRLAWCGARWIGPAPGQIDPKKEVDAAILRMDSGLTTLDDETAELTGGDWEVNHPQQVKERRRREADGLIGHNGGPALSDGDYDEREQDEDRPEEEDES